MDSETKFKLIFGFAVLGVVAILAAVIAIGHIEEKTSFGLQYLLGTLSTLAGAFSTWAFTRPKGEDH